MGALNNSRGKVPCNSWVKTIKYMYINCFVSRGGCDLEVAIASLCGQFLIKDVQRMSLLDFLKPQRTTADYRRGDQENKVESYL